MSMLSLMIVSVLLLLGSLVGENEEGRKLSCTSTACPYLNTLVHDRCLEAFEDHLVKILQNSGLILLKYEFD